MTDSVPQHYLPHPPVALYLLRDAVDPLYKSPPNFTHLLPVSICQTHSPVLVVMKNSHYSPPPNRYNRPLGQLLGNATDLVVRESNKH